jgi:glucose-1-phosphate thymidylyltransferase
MKCLILAGGFATRLYPLTINRAKALLEFNGKPVITHVVEHVPPGIDILVATNKKFQVEFLSWQASLERDLEICIEEAISDEHKMGAIGAVDFWIKNKQIDEDLIVIAADNYFEIDMADVLGTFNHRNALIAVHDVGDKDKACEIAQACQVGLVTLEQNRIVKFDEKPPAPTSSTIATGIYILPSRIFPLLSEYCRETKRDNLGSFISYLLSREEVHAYAFTETWIDIGDEIKRGRISI